MPNPDGTPTQAEIGVGLARLGILAAIQFLLANEKTAAVIAAWQTSGRMAPNQSEIDAMDAESAQITSDYQAALKRAEDEGR